jgi:hypothetical protein
MSLKFNATAETPAKARGAARDALRLFASRQMEFALLAAVTVSVLFAFVLDARFGRAFGQGYVYQAPWFQALLVLLGSAAVSALISRWPWKWRDAGAVSCRIGIVLMVAGASRNFWQGMDGHIVLVPGQSTDQLLLAGCSVVSASWKDRPDEPAFLFTFENGMVDWTTDQALDLGRIDGMRARVLSFFHHGRAVETWTASEKSTGGPLIRFDLAGSDGDARVKHFLTDQDFGAEIFVGPLAVRLRRADSEAMLAQFLRPAEKVLGEKGVLTMYYGNHVEHAAVDEKVGETLKLGETGVTVQLVHYLPHAKLDSAGEFQLISEQPKNPLIELLVHVPGEPKPFRQVAFAKSPLLNLDGVYNRTCPVTFAYQHPNFQQSTAIEFLQSTDGRLFGRVVSRGQIESSGEVTTGSRLDIPGGFALTVTEYVPRADRHISFQPSMTPTTDGRRFEPAAEVEIDVAGAAQSIWLQRDHPEFGRRTVDAPDGPLDVQFGAPQVPLGFSLQLVDFHSTANSASGHGASFSGTVQLRDEETHGGVQRRFSVSQPLSHQGYVFVPIESRPAGHQSDALVFQARFRPGRPWFQFGAIVSLLGLLTIWRIRAHAADGRARGSNTDCI